MTSLHCKNSLIRCLREPHAICTVLSPLFSSSPPFSRTSSSDFRPDIKVDEFARSRVSAGSLQLRVSYILPVSCLILILWWSRCEGISSHFLPKPGDMTIRQWKENFEILTVLYLLSLSARCSSGDVPPSPTGGGRPGGSRRGPAAHSTTEPFLIMHGERQPLSLLTAMSHPASVMVSLEAEETQLLLMLEKNEGLFANHYTETHYLYNGSSVTTALNVTVNCYYHGKVHGHSHSDVSLSTCAGLRGFIALEDKTFILEPAFGPRNATHRIYRAENLSLASGDCGHGLNISHVALDSTGGLFQAFSTRHKRHVQKTTKYVELIIVADNREFQKHGKDVEKVKQRLAEIANYVDKFYRVLNIRVALVGLEVWSDADRCSVTQDPFTTLHEFLDWRKLKLLPQRPHDNAQLVSGVYFQGTTIGMAPIMSMCTAEQSGGVVMDHSENPLGAAVTLAHELGHNFGMNHDTPERGCGCRMTVDRGGCIMTPSTGPGRELKPAGTPCRESSNSCDLPEFCTGTSPHCPANVYLHDGHACHSMDGYCYNGVCQTHEQQCVTLWGPGAKPAPGICFERVNSAGDPYGNCGKDPRGSFAKCDPR
nr:disintegrin and metalloproteinase domain-containing protein 12-like [Paramormyrops kingsleyae]